MSGIVFVDVSRHQGDIDWAAYARAAGSADGNGLTRVAAAICKATGGTHSSGGTSWVDPRLAENRAAMRKLLKVRGYYHFLQLDEDPVAQARHFAKTVGKLQRGEFAVLDVEQDTNAARHERFCDEVDRLIGGRCWIYGGKDVPNPNRRPYWVARYPASGKPEPGKEPTIDHVLWQFSSKGSFPGVAGNVDLNVHRGTLATLAKHAVGAPAPQPKPKPEPKPEPKPKPQPKPPAAKDASPIATLVQVKGDPKVYLVDVATIRHVASPQVLAAERAAGIAEGAIRPVTKQQLALLAKARGVTL